MRNERLEKQSAVTLNSEKKAMESKYGGDEE